MADKNSREARLERALLQIEKMAGDAIDKYAVMSEPKGPPEKWVSRINAVLQSVAPIRDAARAAIKH